MNIATIIEWLNKNRNYSIDSRFYDYIAIWTDWWRGYYKPFHQYKQINPDGTIKERQLYTMRMAKKVCRDWAAILLNEKTQIGLTTKQVLPISWEMEMVPAGNLGVCIFGTMATS